MLKKAALSLSLLALFAFAGTAVASKTSASSSITGPYLASATGSPLTAASATTAQFGDTITFNVSTTATNNPFVNLNCYQNGALVMNSWSAFFPGGGGSRHAHEQRQVEGARVDEFLRQRLVALGLESTQGRGPGVRRGPLSDQIVLSFPLTVVVRDRRGLAAIVRTGPAVIHVVDQPEVASVSVVGASVAVRRIDTDEERRVVGEHRDGVRSRRRSTGVDCERLRVTGRRGRTRGAVVQATAAGGCPCKGSLSACPSGPWPPSS